LTLIVGEDIAGYASRHEVAAIGALRECLDWYGEGLVAPRRPIRYRFADAAAALHSIAAPMSRGKLALFL